MNFTQDDNITFFTAGTEIMRLTSEGMIYKGKMIEDAGEAHKAFLEVMRCMQVFKNPNTGLAGI